MKFYERYLPFVLLVLVTFLLGLGVSPAHSQDKMRDKLQSKENHSFCDSNNYWSDEASVSFREVRELTAPAGGTIKVDGRQNGGISVKGEERSDIVIRACIQAWAKSDEGAKAVADNIFINTSGTVRARADSADGDKNWSVSYEIRVPRSSDLKLTAHNGNIWVTGVDGDVEFETTNGGVILDDDSGAYTGRTTNGGVAVKLTGGTWRGSGLNVTTTNGGVNILMPTNYAANIETGTVNGGFSSDIPALSISTEKVGQDAYWGRQRAKRIASSFNGGGAPIKIITTNGGVKIRADEKD
jgi:hypothetical protein